jgi:integration host factor subunit beta
VTKADLVEQVARSVKLTKKDVGVIVDHLLDEVSRALASGQHVEIRGFGSFKVKTRKERLARNPRTGEAVQVPEKQVPYFKASRELRSMIE